MSENRPPDVDPETKKLACYIAMVVRNAMEHFHCQHLTDDQMRELNPIIRNAICTSKSLYEANEVIEVGKRE